MFHIQVIGHWSGLFKPAGFQSSDGWNIPLKRIKHIAMLVSSFKVLGKKKAFTTKGFNDWKHAFGTCILNIYIC